MTDLLVVRIRDTPHSFNTTTKLNRVTLKRKVRRKNNGWEGPNKTKALACVQRFLHRTLSNTLWSIHSTHPPSFICIPSLPLTVGLNAFAFPGFSLFEKQMSLLHWKQLVVPAGQHSSGEGQPLPYGVMAPKQKTLEQMQSSLYLLFDWLQLLQASLLLTFSPFMRSCGLW